MESPVIDSDNIPQNDTDPPPLFDHEMEQQVLGGLMLDPSEFSKISPELRPEHFHALKHQIIFESIEEYLQAEPTASDIFPFTLKIHLEKRKKLNAVGGLEYLSHLTTKTVTTAHIRLYAQRVTELHARRSLQKENEAIKTAILNRNDDDTTVHAHKIIHIQQGLEEWGPIFPLDEPRLPDWPKGSILSPWADEFATQLSCELQVGRDVTSSITLAAMSIAVAHRFVVHPKPGNYFEGVNLYIVVSLQSGSGKSPVYKRIRAPLEAYQKAHNLKFRAEYSKRRAGYEVLESRVKKAKEKAANARDDDYTELLRQAESLEMEFENAVLPRPLAMFVDDATPEALAKAMMDQGGRMAIFSSEGGDIFATMAGRYQRGELPNLKPYLDPYDGLTLRVNRQTSQSYEIERPCLSMALLTQPEGLKPLGADGIQGRGLNARILFNIASSTLGYRTARAPIMHPAIEDRFAQQMTRLLEYPYATEEQGESCPFVLEFSEGATELYFVFKEELEKEYRESGSLFEISDWGGKILGTTIRIAGILHLGDLVGHPEPWTVPISEDCWMRASRLTQEFWIPHARAAFGLLVEKANMSAAKCLLTWIQKGQQGVFRTRDAQRGMGRRGNRAEVLDPALLILESHGLIQPVDGKPGPKGQMLASIYRVHPRALSGETFSKPSKSP